MSTENIGFQKAIAYLEKRGWEVQDVSKFGNEHGGYDLLIKRESEVFRVEVKSTRGEYKGIPDLCGTEIGHDGLLIAHFLLVVFIPEGLPEKFALIPRDAFPAKAFQPKLGYSIDSAHKNASFIRPFLKAMDEFDAHE